jgi:hypothetical protein
MKVYNVSVQYWGYETWVRAKNKKEARAKARIKAKKYAPIQYIDLEEVEL